MKVVVVGATGLVGSKMVEILEQRSFPITELILVASERSIGKSLMFRGEEIKVVSHQKAIELKPHIALFSAGAKTSMEWAPVYAQNGVIVIDNSSYWRMDSGVKLIVPQVNGSLLTESDRIIANPNCSTIQMVVAINNLHIKYKIKKIVVSTYQSVSGSGVKGLNQLKNEREGLESEVLSNAYTCKIEGNVIPQIDVFEDSGYTKEEMKMVNETRKILQDSSIDVCATAVRVPVAFGHSESIYLEFDNEISIDCAMDILDNTPGVVLQRDYDKYHTPIDIEGKDNVFVSRVRGVFGNGKALKMWVVADNLRKGAATNAIEIAELLIKENNFNFVQNL